MGFEMTQYVINLIFGLSIVLFNIALLGLLKTLNNLRESYDWILELLIIKLSKETEELCLKHLGSMGIDIEAAQQQQQSNYDDVTPNIIMAEYKKSDKTKKSSRKINKNKDKRNDVN